MLLSVLMLWAEFGDALFGDALFGDALFGDALFGDALGDGDGDEGGWVTGVERETEEALVPH